MSAEVVHHKIRRDSWNLGDALWWRDEEKHWVPTEADIKDSLDEGLDTPQEEDYFSETNEYIEKVVSEGEFMSLELGAVYGQGLTLIEENVEVG